MPNLGRWLNRDPLQEAGGINLYAYVEGDPMGYVDPDGRYPYIPKIPGEIPPEAIIPEYIKSNIITANIKAKEYAKNKTQCGVAGVVSGAADVIASRTPVLQVKLVCVSISIGMSEYIRICELKGY